LDLAWYCPSEGDGRFLGTRTPERPPTFDYLLRVVRAAERAGASEILVPTGVVNDSYAPDAPFAESWTTAAGLAVRTRSIRLIVAVNPAGCSPALLAHQIQTLGAAAPGRIALNLVAGGGPVDGYGHPATDHHDRYLRLRELIAALDGRFDGPLYLGGASEDAVALAAEVVDTYLMWGERPQDIAARITAFRERTERPVRFGVRIHIIARSRERDARRRARELVAAAAVRNDRRDEYAGFDSVGQARMNALPADADDWVAPGLWAGIRSVRGGAGTALVGSYDQVAKWLAAYRAVGVDMIIASGYPHLEEVTRVSRHVWPRIELSRRS
jgi:alkanesulfonate monooxygenase